MATDLDGFVQYARALQQATDLRQLLDAVQTAVARVTPYRSITLSIVETTPEGLMARLIGASGPGEPILWEKCPLIPVAGDPMVQEIIRGEGPVVVVDARADPRTNKAIVETLGIHTLINVPLSLGGVSIGALALQTFADQGCIAPTAEHLESLTLMALQLAPAFDRVRLLVRQQANDAEKDQLKLRLQRVERIETLALLAGGVAHDFNNLLTIIVNTLYFLGQLELPPQARQDVEDATDAARRGAEVTRQLLALGRKQPLRLTSTDWGARMKDLLRLLRRLVPESVELVLEVAPALPPVLADGLQLDQVVMNLVLNARDAMPQGGRITLSLSPATLSGADPVHPRVRGGEAVRLTVKDTGLGMTPEVAQHIFEPFFTTKASGAGTGLGLSIVQGVAEQHGGVVDCRSVPGVGTTFEVTVPVATEREAAAARVSPVPRALTGLHVLVAEDDRTIRELVQRILGGAGFRVTAVADGQAAIEAAQRDAPDLVILDAVMPRLSGAATFERLRHQLPEGTAWLFMTGYAADSLPSEILSARTVEILPKPWLPIELLAAVKAAIQHPTNWA